MTPADRQSRDTEELERESELLPQEPPPQIARVFATFLLGLFLVAVVFAAMVPLPESVEAPFVLRTERGADPVNAEQAGTVERVEVEMGSRVHEGDLLFMIRSEDLARLASEREQLAEQVETARQQLAMDMPPSSPPSGGETPASPTLISSLRARVDRLEREQAADVDLDKRLEEQYQALLQAARRNAARSAKEVEERRSRVESLEAMLSQLKDLEKEEVVARRDVLRQQEEAADARADLQESRRTHADALRDIDALQSSRQVELLQRQMATSRLRGEIEEARANLRQEVDRLQNVLESGARRLVYLDSALAGSEGGRLPIRAPFSGGVVSVAVKRPGVAVARGQTLCEITREGSKLYADVSVPETKAANVEPGQGVRLLFDAYPYTRHGVKEAKIVWVSPAARDKVLPAIAHLDDTTMIVDGEKRTLSPGMGGTARIDTGRRTLLEYAFEPIRQLRERLRGG